jgi:hypothetical protein
MTNEQHNTYLAWTFTAHAVFQALMTFVVLLFMSLAFRDPRGAPPPGFVAFIFAFVSAFQLLFIVPSSIAAYGLFKHKSWARMASLIAGVVSALNVPFGSAACAYSLWFFLGDRWRELYEPGSGKYAPYTDGDLETRRLSAEQETRWTGMYTNEDGEVVFRQPQPPDWR